MFTHFHPLRFPHSAVWLPLGLALIGNPLRAAEPLPNVGTVVSLPPLMVEERGSPLVWRYLEAPGLEIISICEDHTLIAFVERYHRLKELLTVVVPDRFLASRTAPESHIIFNEQVGRARSQEVIAEMLKKETGSDTLPKKPAFNRGRPPESPSPTIQFLPNLRLGDLDLSAIFSILGDSSDTERNFTFKSNRIASLLQGRVPALPDWFAIGFAGFFPQLQFNENTIEVLPATWTTEESVALKNDSSLPRTLLPMEELLSRFAPADPAQLTEVDRIWKAQSALFVRWAVTENKGARKESLWKFIDRLEKEPLTEELFREHFGMGFSDARDRLSDYLGTSLQTRLKLEGPKTNRLPRLRVRNATDSEVARIRGGWERLEISYVRQQFPDVVDKYVDQARRTLQRAYDRNDRDPRLLTELGLTELEANNPVSAQNFLQEATARDVARPRAYYELALLRFKALSSDPTVHLTPEQATSILTPLLAARRFSPPFAEIYVLMSEVLRRQSAPPSAEMLAAVNEGARLFPRVSLLMVQAISLNNAAGNSAMALEQADAGRRAARDPGMQGRLQSTYDELAAKKK